MYNKLWNTFYIRMFYRTQTKCMCMRLLADNDILSNYKWYLLVKNLQYEHYADDEIQI
jgi:hypothetical protein